MRLIVCLLVLLSNISFVAAQDATVLINKAIPVSELEEKELPTFPGYKSSNLGEEIVATEDAVRGYFIRMLNMNVGNFAKRTIVQLQIKFVVGVDGTVTVTDMQSEFEAYIKEGERVALQELPKMFPAYRKNKEVSVLYDFPLIFVAKATGFRKTGKTLGSIKNTATLQKKSLQKADISNTSE